MIQMTPDQIERFWAKVDRSGDCWLWTGATSGGGYGRLTLHEVGHYAHRVAYELVVGPIPAGHQVDHRCFVRRCVNPTHLRPATRGQNQQNLRGALRNSRTGIRGVTWHKATQKWRVHVGINHQVVFGGLYDDITDAESAAIELRNSLYTHNDADRERKAP